MKTFKLFRWIDLLFITGFLVMLLACASSEEGGTGKLSLALTDAASDDYQAVYVTIGEIQVHQGDGEDEEGWQTILTPARTYNLLELINGVRESLGIADLDTGSYTQMRLIIGTEPDDGINIFSQSHPFANYVVDLNDEIHELKVPSGEQSGIKIVEGFDINENETTELILDFDASASVVVAGNSGQYLLKPTIKVLRTEEFAIIEGNVSTGEGDELEAVSGAHVMAQIFDGSAADKENEVIIQTSTITDADGNYSLFLEPGTYNLVVYKDGFEEKAVEITVVAGDVVTSDFSLDPTEPGTIAGLVTIADADDETFVTLSFRKSVMIDGNDVMIELVSINVANGGSYSVTLPDGDYEVVSSTFGETTQTASSVTVNAGAETTLDVSF